MGYGASNSDETGKNPESFFASLVYKSSDRNGIIGDVIRKDVSKHFFKV